MNLNVKLKRVASLACFSFCVSLGFGVSGASAQSGHDEYCEPGEVECAWGLQCIDNFCKTVAAGEGDSCGPVAGATCIRSLVCDPVEQICVRQEPTGELGALCFNSSECNEGLRCRDAHCEPIPSGNENTSCWTDRDCDAGLICDFSVCVQRPDRFCRSSDECGEGMACLNNRCLVDNTSGEVGAACLYNEHCDDGFVCIDYQCAQP